MDLGMVEEFSRVLEWGAPDPAETLQFMQDRLKYHTDSWDLSVDLKSGHPDIIVIDARSREAYADGHIPGAVSLPHREMTAEAAEQFDRRKIYVVYCDGIGCNASTTAAYRRPPRGVPPSTDGRFGGAGGPGAGRRPDPRRRWRHHRRGRDQRRHLRQGRDLRRLWDPQRRPHPRYRRSGLTLSAGRQRVRDRNGEGARHVPLGELHIPAGDYVVLEDPAACGSQ